MRAMNLSRVLRREGRPTLRQRFDALRDRVRPAAATSLDVGFPDIVSHERAALPPCPAERLGREVADLQNAHAALDASMVGPSAPAAGSAEERAAEQRLRDLDRLIGDAMEEIGHRQASSLEGVMAHLLVIGDHVRDLTAEGGAPRREKLAESAERHLLSSLACLSALSGCDVADVGGRYLLRERDMRRIADVLAGWDAITRNVRNAPTSGVEISSSDPTFASVEAQLLELNREAEAWAALLIRADREEEAGERAVGHSYRVIRRLAAVALGLPAATMRELALQARLVAWDLNAWWDEPPEEPGEFACRELLSRLMGLGGVSRLPARDFSVEEIEATIAEAQEARR